MYMIQDMETKNYLSELSLQQSNETGIGNWIYTSYTGKCNGLRCYTFNNVEKVLNQLEISNKESGANILLQSILVDENKISLGNRIVKYI